MRVYIALGSNLGNREEYLRTGLRHLAEQGIDITQTASVYSTAPRDVLDQPRFLNTVIEADTALSPQELLATCLDIEQQNKRVRGTGTNKAPRTLDIDIIFYGTEIIRTPELTIPHPRFAVRRFVLLPLAEIAPNFVDPVSGRTIAELLAHCPDDGEVLPAGTL